MRNVVWSIVMVAVGLCGGVATADDSTSVGDKIDQALSAAKSYQVDTTGPGDLRGSMVVVNGVGKRYRSTTNRGDVTIYFVGNTTYEHTAEAGWHRFVMNPSEFAALLKSTTSHRSAEPLPDRLEGGVTVGAIKMSVTLVRAGADPATSMSNSSVCTYDKVTFLPRACTFDQTTMQYSHFNDPSLTIEVPAEAKDAPAINLQPVPPQPSAPPG